MTKRRGYPSKTIVRLAEKAKLAQYDSTIIINAFAGHPVIVIELINSAQRKFKRPAGRRQTAPGPEMRTANYNFDDQTVGCQMPAGDFNRHIRQCAHELGVIRAHRVLANAVILPGLVIVTCLEAEGCHD